MDYKDIKDKNEIVGTLRGLKAISPVVVFILVYLVVSLCVGDFYKIPIVVAMMLSSIWSIIIYTGHPLSERIDRFSAEASQSGIMYMIWIFILAGSFSALAKGIGSIDATVNFTFSVLPARYAVAGLFMAACFISISIGTSVGTVVALAPLAMQMAQAEIGAGDPPLFVAAVLGGAFFGDNLSFISDTTIAATRTQGTDMSDKFKANIWIALPAAIVTLVLYVAISHPEATVTTVDDYNLWLLLPYIVVIGLALCGVNVTIVLCSGILSATVLGLVFGNGEILALFGYMGDGIEQMGGLIVVTLLAGGMLGIIKELGGIAWLLRVLTKRIHGACGAQTAIISLVGIVNICTANNTIAIITVGQIARDIAARFGVDPRKSASLLDTASCIVQCLIPYGAQTLLAATLAGISPIEPLPYLYYPLILAFVMVLSIIFRFPRRLHQPAGRP